MLKPTLNVLRWHYYLYYCNVCAIVELTLYLSLLVIIGYVGTF